MTTNLFEGLSADTRNELFTTLLDARHVRVERIVSHGQASPPGFWYDQDRPEWIVVLEGAATIRFEDEFVELHRGDFVNIPAHRRHRVESTAANEPTVWLAVHYT